VSGVVRAVGSCEKYGWLRYHDSVASEFWNLYFGFWAEERGRDMLFSGSVMKVCEYEWFI